MPLEQGHCFYSRAWHSSFLEQHPGCLHNPLLKCSASGSNHLASEVTRHLPSISLEENSMTFEGEESNGSCHRPEWLCQKVSFLGVCIWTLSPFCSRGFSISAQEPTEEDSRVERCPSPPRSDSATGCNTYPTSSWVSPETNYQSPGRKEGREDRALEPGRHRLTPTEMDWETLFSFLEKRTNSFST